MAAGLPTARATARHVFGFKDVGDKELQKLDVGLFTLATTTGTGLDNRRSLGEILEQEWHRAQRVLSLLFVDIDRFKAYNDAYVIRQVPLPWRPSHDVSPTTSGGRPTALHDMEERSSLSSFPIHRRSAPQ